MERITITIDSDLLAELDRMIERRGYQNRSEALRDLARAGLQGAALEDDEARQCVAALVYVYDHTARELPKRLTDSAHDHHDLGLSTLHVHLDHDSCMEVAVLRGPTRNVRAYADHVIAERGVKYGRTFMIPANLQSGDHEHGHGHGHHHRHDHIHVGKSE
ncbi:MAG: nickel-responsive transcriptional regulator NikR [Rhodospirillaceae bacterium]|nr:MAG: nickel-responsive transcriptional regulator NikR [Rhodospirillaceae bacterium]